MNSTDHRTGPRTGVDETARDFWATRPRRLRSDSKIGGVAAAIARRYRIDPVLVRVGFAVAAVYGGAGVLFYLLGWLLLPLDDDRVSPAEALLGPGRSSQSTPLTVVLAIALIPAVSGVFRASPPALIGTAGVLAALYLLHRGRGRLVETDHPDPASPQPGHGTDPAAGPGPHDAGPHDATTGPHPDPWRAGRDGGDGPGDPGGRRTPPAWDPLGAAPFAWDLPEPTAPQPPPSSPRRRIPVAAITLGLALVVAGAGVALAGLSGWFVPAHIAGLALAVVAAGLLVGAFLRRGRGLVLIAIPLAMVTAALAGAPVGGWHDVGNRRWVATTVGELAPGYRLSAGDGRLDLSGLTVPAGGSVHTEVDLAAGQASVTLPPDLDVRVRCESGLGQVDCLGEQAAGRSPARTVTDEGRHGAGGGFLDLLVHTDLGQVTVRRG
jgi:phage shock protein PspC (stress-responsive transcriptional regulator)